MLLGKQPADEDYLVLGADRAALLRRFPLAREVGAGEPSYLVAGRELALPRGPGSAAGRWDVDADLAARDLTINALALDDDGELYAHPQALEDLRAGILRPAAPGALTADPARVLRAARFAAELPEFTIAPELAQAMIQAADDDLIRTLPCERVAKETLKALAAPRPSKFLDLLDATDNLRPWFVELAAARRIPAGPAPYHTGDLLRHLGRVLDHMAALRPGDSLAGWMALCHDLGKTATDPAGWPAHHNHDNLGRELAERLGRRLGLPRRYLRAGMAAAGLHMLAARYDRLRPGTRVDLLQQLHQLDLLERIFALILADRPEAGLTPDEGQLLAAAQADMRRMRAVRLPAAQRNQGASSGRRLRELRCLALSKVEPQT